MRSRTIGALLLSLAMLVSVTGLTYAQTTAGTRITVNAGALLGFAGEPVAESAFTIELEGGAGGPILVDPDPYEISLPTLLWSLLLAPGQSKGQIALSIDNVNDPVNLLSSFPVRLVVGDLSCESFAEVGTSCGSASVGPFYLGDDLLSGAVILVDDIENSWTGQNDGDGLELTLAVVPDEIEWTELRGGDTTADLVFTIQQVM